MSTLLVLIPLMLANASVDTPQEADILVIADRLKHISVNVGRDPQGRYHCGLDGTTGLAKLDEQLCKTTTKCVRKGAGDDEAIEQCIASIKPSLMPRIRDYLKQNAAGGRS